ncbi:conserved hypothetical protein [Paecilomyces variotii No. 5]|uniref:Uncharacterized protein n=1 Tax=Byssochlamys spectabilis (strain No. 5 / NBRC 109023) TaxID=1356009 RepID=V5G3J0_BYSSN|nr:conserved hypothetical protein [Paecilomyces variotii No. 5]
MDYVSSNTVFTSPPNNNLHESCQRRRSSRGYSLYPPPPPPQSSHSPPSSSPTQLRPAKPFSLQNRRLQLRNAGFRAAQVPSRKISDHLTTTWRSLSGGSEPETDKENLVGSPTHDDSSRDNSLRRRVNVLQEINNSSSRRRHTSPRPSVTTLFADLSPRQHSPDSLSSPSWRKSVPRLDPPISFDGSDDSEFDSAMKSREYSLSGHSPLGHSAGIVRRKRRSPRRQQADYETTKYIEHLEAQLAASQTELDSRQTSPIKPQLTKLRSLNAEIRALKQELADWQDKFESRVREEAGSRLETESRLKAKISALEERIEADQRRIQELVYDNEMQAQKLRNSEALSSTNRSLERRVDVLTELLAVSPTRADAARSPTRVDALSPVKNGTPRLRPRSMMPCIPCSPRARQDGAFQPLAVDVNTSDDVPCLSVETAENMNDEQTLPDMSSPSTRPDSIFTDSLSADSTLLSSMPKSQRNSTMSQLSSTSGWGLPFPFTPDPTGRRQSRHKSMRRFPSGTCNLKPLILPSATGTMSDCPPSATFDHLLSPQRDSQYLEPPRGFLDEQDYDSWDDKSTSGGAQQNSLDALEGRTHYYESYEEAISGRQRRRRLDISPVRRRESELRSPGPLSARFPHETILEEESYPEFETSPQPGLSLSACSSPEAAHGQFQQQSLLAHEIGQDYMQTPSRGSLRRYKKQRFEMDRTPQGKRNEFRPNSCSPISGAVCGEAVDILTKYSSWFKQLQRHPTELARRIIANAWHSNWKRLGKLSWWVLGLFFGPQVRHDWCRDPSATEVDNYDWHRYSMATFQVRHGSEVVDHQPDADTALLSETCNRLSGSAWCDVSRARDDDESASNGQLTKQSSFGRSLSLWAKFSFAIVIAIGLAIKNGPGSLLEENPQARSAVIFHDSSMSGGKGLSPGSGALPHARRPCSSQTEDTGRSEMSGSTAFVEDDFPQSLVWTPYLPVHEFPRD